MLFSSWLRNGKRSARSTRRRTSTSVRQRAGFRPRLETLENRVVLSATAIVQTNLVSDNTQFTPAQVQDRNLVNPWGLAAGPGREWWIANQGTGTSTLYDTSNPQVSQLPLVVNIPASSGTSVLAAPKSPTGTVYNGGGGFDLVPNDSSSSSLFLFDTIDGTISGWSPSVDPTHAIVMATSSSAVYTGLAIATDSGGDTQLYAANFVGGIDVYNSNFQLVNSPGSFTDPQLPSGYTAFNVQAINNLLYVEYAPVGNVLAGTANAGDGAVDVYNADGVLQQRLILPGNSHLNDPWAVAMAPANFGSFSNDLLVGDFGNGHIEAFNPANGDFVGELDNADGQPIAITHLWGLAFGNGGAAGPTNTLYFTAGLTSHLASSNNPFHGLFGSLQVAPSPGASVEGNALWLVGGDHTNDHVNIEPVGSSDTGSTGIEVQGRLDGVNFNNVVYNPAPAMIYVVGSNGNEHIHEANSLTIPTNVNEGSGNDDLQLGNGDNSVAAGSGNDFVRLGSGNDAITLGNGNDIVLAGNGNNAVTAGNGNDVVLAGNGNNIVTLGNGNDNTLLGNGDNIVVEGNGRDNILAGNGDNLLVAGLGRHVVLAGNGNNILIDGGVSQTTAELLAALDKWMNDIAAGDSAATIASDLSPSLTVDYNAGNANLLYAGHGLDWFWATYAHDHTNRKSTDLLN